MLELKGTWNIVKGQLKQRFAKLADDEQQFVEGKEDELVGRIQKRTGKNREKKSYFSRELPGMGQFND